MYTPVLLYKSGVYGGQNYIGMFSWCETYHNPILQDRILINTEADFW